MARPSRRRRSRREVALGTSNGRHRKLRSSVRYGTKDGPAVCPCRAGGVKIRSNRILVRPPPPRNRFSGLTHVRPKCAAIWIGVSTRVGARPFRQETCSRGRRPRRRPQRGRLQRRRQFHESAEDESPTGSLENDASKEASNLRLACLQHRRLRQALSSARSSTADRLVGLVAHVGDAERLALELAVAAVDQEAVLDLSTLTSVARSTLSVLAKQVERDGTEAFLGEQREALGERPIADRLVQPACRA